MNGTIRAAVTLVLAALLLWEGARIITTGALPVPQVTLPPAAPKGSPTPAAGIGDAEAGRVEPGAYGIIAARNLFHPDRKPVTEEPTPAPVSPQARAAKQEAITLFGIVVDGTSPRALVKAGGRTELRTVRPGDEIVPGVTVKEITIGQMVILEGGAERTVRVEGTPGGGSRAGAVSQPTATQAPSGGARVPPQPRSPRMPRPMVTPSIPSVMQEMPAMPGMPAPPLPGLPSPMDIEIIEGTGIIPE